MIKDLEVYDIDKLMNLKLSEYKNLYSENGINILHESINNRSSWFIGFSLAKSF